MTGFPKKLAYDSRMGIQLCIYFTTCFRFSSFINLCMHPDRTVDIVHTVPRHNRLLFVIMTQQCCEYRQYIYIVITLALVFSLWTKQTGSVKE